MLLALHVADWALVRWLLAVMFKAIFYNLPHPIPVVFIGPSPPVRAEEVDRTLQRQDSGVESALLYAKAWSKYTKELLAWVEKRLSVGELAHRWRDKYKSFCDMYGGSS